MHLKIISPVAPRCSYIMNDILSSGLCECTFVFEFEYFYLLSGRLSNDLRPSTKAV